MIKLYSKNKTGKTLEWSASLLDINEDGYIPIEIVFGQLGGKLQTKYRYVKSGKNIGKKNETTLLQQAELELGYLVEKQIDSGYVYDIEDYVEPCRPQLAHKYKDKKHIIWYIPDEVKGMNRTHWASRKLNGIRCFIFVKNNKVQGFVSRTGKDFKFFTHIAESVEVNNLYESHYILDGELFNKDIPFEVLCSLINSDEYVELEYDGKMYDTSMVEFHLYDFVCLEGTHENSCRPDDSYYDRFVDNYTLLNFGPSVIKLGNERVETEERVFELTRQYMDEGYEGLMLRSGWASYEFGKRSNNLLKVKLFESDEFRIKDIYLAENDTTKVMFTLHNHLRLDDIESTFECSIKGSREFNMQYYTNKEQYINKWCTVSYQALSSYNVPLFAQIEALREGEVIDGRFYPSA